MSEPVVVERATRETRARVVLGGSGEVRVGTGVAMLDHLLEQLGTFSGLGLEVAAEELVGCGEGHHLVEDVAVALGRALDRHLGDRAGVARYGQRWLPMDEALVLAVVDLGGRPFCRVEGRVPASRLGGVESENVPHFFRSLALEARVTLHLAVSGENAHHVAEAAFKAVGLALAEAMTRQGSGVRSTKGVLR